MTAVVRLFLETSGGLLLAGVSVGQVEGPDFSEETQGQYGPAAVYERVFTCRMDK